ncbi:putative porin [Aquimarina agarilytica]|uniref:putative porin n=1 Tax=Aquimarina agarilytica TaxID=1087449 RepID=UPI00028991C1|nr:putative porin [Aquimarina agarilytica]
MKQFSLLFFIIVFSLAGKAQVNSGGTADPNSVNEEDSSSKRKFSGPKEKKKKPPIELYKIISAERDTTYLDTTLSIQKDYKFNYLRKDDFEFVPFPNVGSPYVQLAKQEKYFEVMPHFGARTRHLAYLEAKDINYYSVPTPLTDLYYKTAVDQGQQLDAFLTVNTSPNVNFSIAYKGIRSLGDYINSLTSTRAFRSTLSYTMPNKRYTTNFHFADQSIFNEENGGLSGQDLLQFLEANENFDNRSSFDPSFISGGNELEGKRLYLDHEYRIFMKDTLQTNELSVRHKLEYTTKQYTFTQENATEAIFGEAENTGSFRDKTELEYLTNQLGLQYSNDYLGELSFFVKYSSYNYGYDKVIIQSRLENEDTNPIVINTGVIEDRLSGDVLSFVAHYKNKYKGFLLEGDAQSTISGEYENQYFFGQAGYQYKDDISVKFGYRLASEAPNYNYLLNQSNFIEYNWQNDFKNVITNTFSANIDAKKIANLEGSYSIISDYTYFGRREVPFPSTSIGGSLVEETTSVSTPIQTSTVINLFKLKAFREFKFKNFRLANTILFQQAIGNDIEQIYNVPQFVTRNSLYYQNKIFKRAMFVQIGLNFKYFTSYFTDGYDPLIAENYVQSTQKFGDHPMVDVFLNAKVRQTRIFFKLENAQHLLKKNTELVAPGFPSRDFLIRFGLVWNFFL